jgi:hypothetical protein
MNDTQDKELRAVVAAGWRAAVIGAIGFMVAWGFFVALMHIQPEWVLDLWGGSVTWETAQTVSIWFFAALKFLWFIFLFALMFAALYRRQLKRLA